MDKNVLVTFKKVSFKEIFKNLTKNFERGKIYLILGENGSGKTSLLYLIQGLYKPCTGELFFEGKPYDYSKKWLYDLRQKIVLLFQNPDYQIVGLTVKDDVAIYPKFLGMSSQQLEFMVEEALKRYGIYDLRNRKTDEISYGEKKKVAMAGLSILNPQVALLDEPYSGMDSEGRRFITDYILDLKSKNKTVIITSHELGEFVSLADEILYIRNKNLLESHQLEETMPIFIRNILLLVKYGYLTKPLPEEILYSGEGEKKP